MTNYEKYKDEIIEMISELPMFAVTKGKIKRCVNVKCDECEFNKPFSTCQELARDWLNAEYEEPKDKNGV